jgi:hypothetical protein
MSLGQRRQRIQKHLQPKYYGNSRWFNIANTESYSADIGWMSYFGKNLIAYMGEDKIQNLTTYAEKLTLDNGVLITLQKEPFDANNPAHREREAKAVQELGLGEPNSKSVN